MSLAALRVPHSPPLPSPQAWTTLLGPSVSVVDPRVGPVAAYYNGHTYIAYSNGDGEIRVASYSHSTQTITVSPAILSGFGTDPDRHIAAAIIVRQSDHKLLLVCSEHATSNMHVVISSNAEDVSSWGSDNNIGSSLGGSSFYTYATLHQLSGESGKVYLFWRDGDADGSPNPALLRCATSTDGGATWGTPFTIYSAGAGLTPYWSIISDGNSRIDFAPTDGDASSGDTASLYHFYYTGGNYYKSDGTQITTTRPYVPGNLTKVHDGATNGSLQAPWGISSTGPTLTWIAYDPTGSGSDTIYWYGRFSGGSWSVHQIGDTGSLPSNIMGGIAIDRNDPSKLYVGKTASGVWQMFLYQTSDGGATWTTTQLTHDTDQPNTWPFTPINAASGLSCAWLYGPQTPATSYSFGGQMRGYPNPHSPF